MGVCDYYQAQKIDISEMIHWSVPLNQTKDVVSIFENIKTTSSHPALVVGNLAMANEIYSLSKLYDLRCGVDYSMITFTNFVKDISEFSIDTLDFSRDEMVRQIVYLLRLFMSNQSLPSQIKIRCNIHDYGSVADISMR